MLKVKEQKRQVKFLYASIGPRITFTRVKELIIWEVVINFFHISGDQLLDGNMLSNHLHNKFLFFSHSYFHLLQFNFLVHDVIFSQLRNFWLLR